MPAGNVSIEAVFYQSAVTLTPNRTYIDFRSDYNSADYRNEETTKAGYLKISGEKLAAQNASYEQQATGTIISIDASDYVGKIRSATLKLTGSAADANTSAQYAKFANYIDFTENASITGSNLGDLSGTVTYMGNIAGINKDVATNISTDITKLLRAANDGKISLGVYTTTGRLVTFTDWSIDLTLDEDDLTAATVTVNQMYNDGESNVAIPTTSGTTDGANWAAGDTYSTTMGDTAATDVWGKHTFARIIDQPSGDPKAKYVYASGAADNQALTAGDNVINLVYNQYKYATATFTAKVSDTATAGIPIVISAASALTDGSTYTTKTVTTGEDGIISEDLLPGSYTWAVANGGSYEEGTGNFTVANDGAAVPVAVNLTGVSQTLTDITLDTSKLNTGILTTSQTSKVVGTISSTQVDADDNAMATQQDGVTYSVTPSDAGVAVASDGTVTITNATTTGNYVIKATVDGVTTSDEKAYTMTVAATGPETVARASDDFSGSTNIFGGGTAHKVGSTNAISIDNTTINAPVNVTLGSDEKITVSYTQFNGYFNSSQTSTVSFKNGDTVLASYTYNVKDCDITDIKINGAAPTDFATFHAQSCYNTSGDANGWGGNGKPYVATDKYNPQVTVEINGDGTVKLTIDALNKKTPGTYVTKTFTGTVATTGLKLSDINITSNISNTDRTSGIANLVTTLTKAE